MQDCHEATIARLIVSDPERTSEIFLEKGICYTESGVLVAVLRHGPADLKKCLDALYAAEMNVNFLLSPCCLAWGGGLWWLFTWRILTSGAPC